jgi:hypothetical protein
MKAIVHWDHKPGASHETLRHFFQAFDYVARSFAVELIFVDLTNTMEPLVVPNEVHRSLPDALKVAGGTPVYFRADGATELEDWVPDTDTVLVIGPDYGSLEVPPGAKSVRLTVPNPEPELWSHNVLTAACYAWSRRDC